jgi:hypothetical protein
MKKQDEIYKVLEPLVNQILFGKNDKPIFNSSKIDLSREYIEVCNKLDNEDVFKTFLKKIL